MRLFWIARCFAFCACLHVLWAAPGVAQERVSRMTMDQIADLAGMTDARYFKARDEFLANTAKLPKYSYGLDQADPRFRVQYLILQGWQKNEALFRSLDAELSAVNAEFERLKSNAFDPINNSFRVRSGKDWKRDGLPFGWERFLKMTDAKEDWQVTVGYFMMQEYPHGDTIDAALVALNQFRPGSNQHRLASALLREMPAPDLRERLQSEQAFHVASRPALQDALKGR